jgi:hypothetical protein
MSLLRLTCCQNQSFFIIISSNTFYFIFKQTSFIISYNLDLKVKTNCFETVTASLARFGFFFKKRKKEKKKKVTTIPNKAGDVSNMDIKKKNLS